MCQKKLDGTLSCVHLSSLFSEALLHIRETIPQHAAIRLHLIRSPALVPRKSHHMHSLLARWLQKCHRVIPQSLRSSVYKDASESTAIPTKYLCEDLAREFSTYWAEMGEIDGEGLERIQTDALACWHAFWFLVDECAGTEPLPIDFFVGVFDDYFFLGSLRAYISVAFVSERPENAAWVGLTTRAKNHKDRVLSPPEVQIQLKWPIRRPWSRELVQELLDTLMHEMSHAFLIVYGTAARCLVETEGVTGHGPCWVKIAAAVAAEADRALGERWDRWELKIADSCQLEDEARRGKGEEVKRRGLIA